MRRPGAGSRAATGIGRGSLMAAAEPGELETIPGTRTLWTELRWAAQQEAVVHLEDLMLRRTRIALLLEKRRPGSAAPHKNHLPAAARLER